ncbi:MAG TPA: hypothetical protein VK859_07190 [bacterium]|jgi:hypothetical protein|nr:hypothetical protein [bacterium]
MEDLTKEEEKFLFKKKKWLDKNFKLFLVVSVVGGISFIAENIFLILKGIKLDCLLCQWSLVALWAVAVINLIVGKVNEKKLILIVKKLENKTLPSVDGSKDYNKAD